MPRVLKNSRVNPLSNPDAHFDGSDQVDTSGDVQVRAHIADVALADSATWDTEIRERAQRALANAPE